MFYVMSFSASSCLLSHISLTCIWCRMNWKGWWQQQTRKLGDLSWWFYVIVKNVRKLFEFEKNSDAQQEIYYVLFSSPLKAKVKVNMRNISVQIRLSVEDKKKCTFSSDSTFMSQKIFCLRCGIIMVRKCYVNEKQFYGSFLVPWISSSSSSSYDEGKIDGREINICVILKGLKDRRSKVYDEEKRSKYTNLSSIKNFINLTMGNSLFILILHFSSTRLSELIKKREKKDSNIQYKKVKSS